MPKDNRDRYGYRHREDSAYEIGESMPGDVGDSKGTFHDRARQNNNVVVDGEVRSMESHQRSSVEANEQVSNSKNTSSRSSTESISQSEAHGMVVELTVDKHEGHVIPWQSTRTTKCTSKQGPQEKLSGSG